MSSARAAEHRLCSEADEIVRLVEAGPVRDGLTAVFDDPTHKETP